MADNRDISDNDKIFGIPQTAEGGGEEFTEEYTRPFAVRMALADEKTRSRYNAVKNAVCGYVSADGISRVAANADAMGEELRLDGALLCRIRLVRGYIRLFLNLRPKKYYLKNYNCNDYSRAARYSGCPLEIDICSAASIRAAYALIDEVMRARGAIHLRSYVADDLSAVYEGAQLARAEPFDVDDMAAADAALSDDKIADDAPAEEEQNYVSAAESAPDEGAEDAARGGVERLPVSPVRLPVRARVVDEHGESAGKIRGSVWYNCSGMAVGSFRRTGECAVCFDGAGCSGFVDKNDNIVACDGRYIATIRRFPFILLIVALAVLALATALTATLSAHFLARTDMPVGAPVLFVADEHGNDWNECENLPVFYNAEFGTQKIAPGMSGSYSFTLQNENAYPIEFALTFSCENPYGIDLVYSLWRDGVCLSGEGEGLPPDELGLGGMTLEGRSDTLFTLKWEWVDDDVADTVAGESGAMYTLTILFEAHAAEGGQRLAAPGQKIQDAAR